jgi:hypothetical protein
MSGITELLKLSSKAADERAKCAASIVGYCMGNAVEQKAHTQSPQRRPWALGEADY